MFVSHSHRRPPARRGAILIVVLAMLALFAVVGLSFVLYADSQANSAKQNKIAENKDTPPDPFAAAQQWTGVFLYDVGDTNDDLMNPMRGHALARSKYGFLTPTLPNQNFNLSAFAGSGTVNETIPAGRIPGVAVAMNRTQIVNFMYNPTGGYVIDPERQTETGPIPFRGLAQIGTPPSAAFGGNYVNKAAPYTYPDRNNFFLAMMDATTGQIVTPSFHRSDLFTNTNPLYTTAADQIAQSLNPNNPKWTAAAPEGRLMTLRPRLAEHPNFPQVPPNADGTYTGDVSNLKFLTGSQKNDSLWMDAGGPVLEWRGRKYKAVIAPLVLDLSGRVNLSVAGNVRLGDTNPADIGGMNPDTYKDQHPRHTSLHGFGPHEVNPTAVFPTQPASGAWGGPNWELFSLLRQRFPQPTVMPIISGTQTIYGAIPQADPLYQSNEGRLNHVAPPLGGGGSLYGLAPPPYGKIDSDGVTNARPIATTTDPMFLPAPAGFGPFPTFPGTRFSPDQNVFRGVLINHPSMYNPFLLKRGGPTTAATATHPFGNDDAIQWMTRYTDSKQRYTNSNLYKDTAATMAAGGWGAPTNLQSPFVRATTTTFSTSQQWAEVPLATGATTFVNLGPVDVNRPLAEYRKTAIWYNAAAMPPRYEPVPHSPANLWNPNVLSTAAAPLRNEPVYYASARQARQNLARDLFVRLVALSPFVDGTNIAYNPATGYFVFAGAGVSALPAATQVALRQYAQLAANIVDYVDADDISTAFVWNPVNPLFQATYSDGPPLIDPITNQPILDPSADPANFAAATIGDRVVYGTELPRLVINEAYGVVANHREDTGPFATRYLKRRYWFELHNPLPADAAQPVLSDGGAARLQYESGVTVLQDPTNPANTAPYAGATYNPYRVEVAVVPSGMGVQTPYSTFLATNTNPVPDTAAVPGMTLQARVNTYTQDVNAPAPPMPLLAAGADPKNLVLPANGAATGPNGDRQGYYLIGPRDQFPAGSVTNSLNLPDPPVTMGVDSVPPTAAAPADALTFSVTPAPPTNPNIDAERAKTSVVILRRLANPYLPPQENPVNPNYNPYVTVDFIENLPTWDRATKNSTMPIGTHTPPPGDDAKPTVGRVHPYVAFPTYGSATASDGVRDQVGAMGVSPPHTLFAGNSPLDNARGAGTVGLEWLTHLDRQVVNSLELLHVSTQSPALLTQKFFSERVDPMNTPFMPRVFEYQRHTTWSAQSATNTDPLVPALRTPNWHRVLDLIVAGNRMPGVPVGGREPGKINPNTINHPALLNAALDPQPGNAFGVGAYAANPTVIDPTTALPLWDGLVGTPASPYARTPNGAPRATFAETGVAGGDRPFRSFLGSPDIQDSLLRLNVAGTAGSPVAFNNAAAATHPHVQAEPLRKMLNSLTPTSDSFLVVMTVGFFEVTNNGPYAATNQPVLGKELFDRVPGDLRTQFASIVDRSQLAVDHDGATGAISANVASTRLPVQMKLLRDADIGANQIVVEAGPGGTLYDNGLALGLAPGRLLRLGGADVSTTLTSGANTVVSGDGEWVQIANVSMTIPTPVQPLKGPDATGNPTQVIPGHYLLTLEPAFTPANAPPGWVAGVVNRNHSAGTKVGTVVLGNPGPQPGITLDLLRQRGLVPYFTRLDP